MLSAKSIVSELTVVVVPDTVKLPVITIVSPASFPIVIFSFADPPEDSKFASLVSKLALLMSLTVVLPARAVVALVPKLGKVIDVVVTVLT